MIQHPASITPEIRRASQEDSPGDAGSVHCARGNVVYIKLPPADGQLCSASEHASPQRLNIAFARRTRQPAGDGFTRIGRESYPCTNLIPISRLLPAGTDEMLTVGILRPHAHFIVCSLPVCLCRILHLISAVAGGTAEFVLPTGRPSAVAKHSVIIGNDCRSYRATNGFRHMRCPQAIALIAISLL